MTIKITCIHCAEQFSIRVPKLDELQAELESVKKERDEYRNRLAEILIKSIRQADDTTIDEALDKLKT